MKTCTLTVLLKSGLSRFTSPIKIVFAWNVVLSVNVKYLQENFLKLRLKKSMLKNVLTVHTIFKIFLQNYSLSITNAHRSLGKRLWGRRRGLRESSGFSHPLGRVGVRWWLVGVVTTKIPKFSTLFIAQDSWFTIENLVIFFKRSIF